MIDEVDLHSDGIHRPDRNTYEPSAEERFFEQLEFEERERRTSAIKELAQLDRLQAHVDRTRAKQSQSPTHTTNPKGTTMTTLAEKMSQSLAEALSDFEPVPEHLHDRIEQFWKGYEEAEVIDRRWAGSVAIRVIGVRNTVMVVTGVLASRTDLGDGRVATKWALDMIRKYPNLPYDVASEEATERAKEVQEALLRAVDDQILNEGESSTDDEASDELDEFLSA